MRKKNIVLWVVLTIVLGAGVVWKVAFPLMPLMSWNYKMTVIVETPEGVVTGSSVREMSNVTRRSYLPEVGNPASVKGEAVIVDLGKRGVLFALISENSDMEFYNAYSHLWSRGGSTPEGIRFYAQMPVGTKGTLNPVMPPGYPKLVAFKNINDPKSVIEAQIWERKADGKFFLKEDRMEELFGAGVKLKDITLEITDEPVTWGRIDAYLPINFYEMIVRDWQKFPMEERGRLVDLITFKQGDTK